MTFPHTLDTVAEVPAALTAFLRGVERRAAVFAELQCGDIALGDRALVSATAKFRVTAARTPIAEWPQTFWALLLAAPELRVEPLAPEWSDDFMPLARIGRGPRAAVLLRIVAGLSEADAAAVLGIAPDTYRLALQEALPRRADGSADGEAWLALNDDARRAIRDLPVDRIASLARQREAALIGAEAAARIIPSADPPPFAIDAPAARPRKWLRWLWGGLGICVAAFAATFFLPDIRPESDPGGDPQIRIEPLPPVEPPAARYDETTALLTEPDFELLKDENGERIARDVAFYGWLDNRQAQTAQSAAMTSGTAIADTASDHRATPESIDAP